MKTYRLPHNMGGHPVDVLAEKVFLGDLTRADMWAVVVNTGDDSFPMFLPPTVVVEVLPVEPEDGSDWRAGDVIYSRRDSWKSSHHEYRWYSTDGSGTYVWSEVVHEAERNGPLERLVRDPADQARDSRIAIPTARVAQKLLIDPPDPAGYIQVRCSLPGEPALINAEGAEQAAAVLLRNAREVRAADDQQR